MKEFLSFSVQKKISYLSKILLVFFFFFYDILDVDRIGEVSMKEKIKESSKKYLIGFILGLITTLSVSVIAATYFPSNQTTYDNSVSGLQSTNVQDAIDELYGVCFPPTLPAIDTITNLLPSNPDELYKDEHGDIRYYGATPNNYVSFNNELWRIIGVIDGKIKIIRNESIGEMEWASNRKNNWNNASLKSYLNGEYYNSIDGTYKSMISEETYYLGGATSSNYQTLTASGYYDIERSNNVYGSNPTSTIQYIGLMYPSDYGYAAGSSCLSTVLYYYNISCKNSDYLSIGVTEWLQAPAASHSDTAAYLFSPGYVGTLYNVANSYAVRPVLYLTSETQIIGGDGSQENAFKLG